VSGPLLDRLPDVAFVGGKGGVGKTTIAAALAVASADGGRRTLLVSTDPAHSTTDVLGDSELAAAPRPASQPARASAPGPGNGPTAAPAPGSAVRASRAGSRRHRAVARGDSSDPGPGPTTAPGRPAEAASVLPGLDLLELDGAAEADRYIADVKARIREVASPRMLKEVEREVDIARASPGAEEAAVFDRFARLMPLAGGAYDRVIFDTAPTGHTLRLLALPERMEAWAAGLVSRRRKLRSLGRMWRNVAGAAAGSASPRRRDADAAPADADPVLAALEARQERFRTARDIVTDPDRAGFLFVLIPERLPILETGRAVDALRRYGIPLLGLVVNRVLPDRAEGDFLARRRDRQAAYLARIHETFHDLPRWQLPLEEQDVVGPDPLRRLARALSEPDPV
jgi:arsenite-transporting ATPase